MKKLKKILLSPATLAFATVAGLVAFLGVDGSLAASENLIRTEDRPDAAVNTGLQDAVRMFINYFLLFLGIIAVGFIIYAGVLMVTAQGEEEQVNKGKKIITWAAIGIVIILLSYSIVRWIIAVGDGTTT